jgi:alkaline phosphatase
LRPSAPIHSRRTAACLLIALLATAPAPARADRTGTGDAHPRNLILLISDGCGPASFDLARAVAGRPLAIDAILTGSVETASADNRITDSAAGATAFATGERTVNRRLGRDPTGAPLTSWFEIAGRSGFATGLVATTDITDATPAAFVAHVHDRASEDSVAVQMLARHVDVILGGGRDWFVPRAAGGRRTDGRDLIAEARRMGYQVAATPADLAGGNGAGDARRLIGLFAGSSFEFVLDRVPSAQPELRTMERAALQRLTRRARRFVLMVEGSRIDHAAHRNDPGAHAAEVLEYDAMVRDVLEFARRDGHTLVVSVSDHETGGLSFTPPGGDGALDPEVLRGVHASTARIAAEIAATRDTDGTLARDAGLGSLTPDERRPLASAPDAERLGRAVAAIESRRAHVRWSTTGHTATDVRLFAFGPGAGVFHGTLENRELGHRLAAALDLERGGGRGAAAAHASR